MIRRIMPFAAIAIVASLLIVVPALGSTNEDAVRLHLGTDGVRFSYNDDTQTLTTARNGCQLTTASASGPLIQLSSTSAGTSQPGLASLSLGVKSSGSNSNGTPCSQVDSAESLTLAAGSGLAGRSFNAVRLDVEMTGNAIVKVDFLLGSSTTPAKTATLQTGTNIDPFQTVSTPEDPYDIEAPYLVSTDPVKDADLTDACAAPNSSGPNSAGNDNCLWSIDPGVTFDRIRLRTTVGTVSLDGSGDFANNTDHDTLLFLANATPTADDDTYTTDEDTTLNVAAPGVLGNDADADGDGITAVIGDDVTNGTLILDADGSFSYTPNENYFGSDSFTYTATDGTASSTAATVSITVNAVNDAPTVSSPSVQTNEDTQVTIPIGDLGSDVENDQLTVEIIEGQGPANGTAVVNTDGSVTYTPNANTTGTDSFTFRVCEVLSGVCSTGTATVSISVGSANDPPVATDDVAYVDAGGSVLIDVLGGDDPDTDVDGDPLTISAVSSVDPVIAGTVEINQTMTAVTFAAGSDEDFTGSATFTYTVSDGNGGTDTGTVTVFELFECGETLTVTEGDTSAEYQRLPEQEGCGDGKPYFVDIITTTQGTTPLPTIVFQPRSRTGDAVEDCSVTPELCLDEFAATITFGPRPEANAPDTGTLHYDPVNREPSEYDAGGTFRDMQWCQIPEFDPYAPGRPASSLILPAGESWCIASVSTSSSSTSETLTTWVLYGIGDPAKRI